MQFHRLFCFLLLIYCSLSAACGASAENEAVTITDRRTHYDVVLNLENGASHRAVGEEYGAKIRSVVPQFEQCWDSYIKEYGGNWLVYKILLGRVKQMKDQIPQDVRDEIEGIASQLSGGDNDKPGDGKVSINELYLLNLIGDACRMNQCCAVSVFGERSANGQTICGRNLDWPDGSANQLAQIQAVITYKNGAKSIVSVACIGFQGIVSGFNGSGVFAGILDSGTGAKYSAKNRRSYAVDLRFALEHSNSVEQVGEVMSKAGPYTFNHLIILADRRHSAVLENNFSGGGENPARALRYWNSDLNPSTTWGIPYSVGAVNCFALRGNTDNHIDPLDWKRFRKGEPDSDVNTLRWQSMKEQLTRMGSKVDATGVKSVLSFYYPKKPFSMYHGDLYHALTFQSMIFEPNSMSLQVWFKAKDGKMYNTLAFEPIHTTLNSAICRTDDNKPYTPAAWQSPAKTPTWNSSTAGTANSPWNIPAVTVPDSAGWNIPSAGAQSRSGWDIPSAGAQSQSGWNIPPKNHSASERTNPGWIIPSMTNQPTRWNIDPDSN